MPAPVSVRITVATQALNEAGETVGAAVREEQTILVPSVPTFDPARRVVATRARDLGERVAVGLFDALGALAKLG